MPRKKRYTSTKKRRVHTPAPPVVASFNAPRPEADGDPRPIQIPRVLTVKELGDLMGVTSVEVIKELMKNGVMATINQNIDYETAAIVAHDLNFLPEELAGQEAEDGAGEAAPGAPIEEEEGAALQPRQPVVTVLGHVDHGKTSLLDAIRQTNVTEGEKGGITQHIGAYQVEANDQHITFLDTPGHAAFTAMRARGAQVTDLAVLVVAADDGVMPQTVEAIDHARAAGVPVVVAITKTDLEDANVDRIKPQLAEHGLTIEEYGGDVACVAVSAKTGAAIQDLLENILVAAEVLDLKANTERPAIGAIIEAEMDRRRGATATALVQTGTLRVGDVVVAGETWGRVKAMFNEHGQRIKSAGPGEPVAVLGLQEVPAAGDTLKVVADDKQARRMVVQRLREKQAASLHAQPRVTLDTLFGEISAGKVKELNLILKTDVQGSIEPIRQSLEKLSTDEVRVKTIHTSTGWITESDVMLAIASHAIIIGFNTKPEPGTERLIEQEGVDLRLYNVIYNVTDDVQNALLGMLEPKYEEIVSGHAEVRQIFKIKRRQVAGCYVRDGVVTRTDLARVLRDGEQLAETKVDSLRRFQEDTAEVREGFECGIALEEFHDFQEGDVLELYRLELVTRGTPPQS